MEYIDQKSLGGEFIETDEPGEDIPVPQIIEKDVKNLKEFEGTPLRVQSQRIHFPLKDEDMLDFVKLIKRFEDSKKLSSLSLPQLGINKCAFIFALDGKEAGNENEQTYKRNVWVNPIYNPVPGATLDEGYEACASISSDKTLAVAPVFRYNKIYYRTYDMLGRILEGVAHGFAARAIQHEIDHLNGKLFVDLVQPEKIIKYTEYGEQLKEKTLPPLQTGIVPPEQ